MKIVDVHCHLESAEFGEDLSPVINDAVRVGVVRLITSSITPAQWKTSQAIAEKYREVEFSLGIHPWYISLSYLDSIGELYSAEKIGAVAIGETGLDSKIENPDLELQMKFFENQLAVAREINLPLIIHCRGAFNELMGAFRRIGVPDAGGIIHSFSGSLELARQLIPFGMNFSMGGVLTYRNSKKRERLLKHIYPRHFLLETDSPDILPVHIKERPNVPSNIIHNLKAAAEIIADSAENVARHTTDNALRILNLTL